MKYQLLRAGDERTWAVVFDVTGSPGHLRRRFAPDFGIALIDLAARAGEVYKR